MPTGLRGGMQFYTVDTRSVVNLSPGTFCYVHVNTIPFIYIYKNFAKVNPSFC